MNFDASFLDDVNLIRVLLEIVEKQNSIQLQLKNDLTKLISDSHQVKTLNSLLKSKNRNNMEEETVHIDPQLLKSLPVEFKKLLMSNSDGNTQTQMAISFPEHIREIQRNAAHNAERMKAQEVKLQTLTWIYSSLFANSLVNARIKSGRFNLKRVNRKLKIDEKIESKVQDLKMHRNIIQLNIHHSERLNKETKQRRETIINTMRGTPLSKILPNEKENLSYNESSMVPMTPILDDPDDSRYESLNQANEIENKDQDVFEIKHLNSEQKLLDMNKTPTKHRSPLSALSNLSEPMSHLNTPSSVEGSFKFRKTPNSTFQTQSSRAMSVLSMYMTPKSDSLSHQNNRTNSSRLSRPRSEMTISDLKQAKNVVEKSQTPISMSINRVYDSPLIKNSVNIKLTANSLNMEESVKKIQNWWRGVHYRKLYKANKRNIRRILKYFIIYCVENDIPLDCLKTSHLKENNDEMLNVPELIRPKDEIIDISAEECIIDDDEYLKRSKCLNYDFDHKIRAILDEDINIKEKTIEEKINMPHLNNYDSLSYPLNWNQGVVPLTLENIPAFRLLAIWIREPLTCPHKLLKFPTLDIQLEELDLPLGFNKQITLIPSEHTPLSLETRLKIAQHLIDSNWEDDITKVLNTFIEPLHISSKEDQLKVMSNISIFLPSQRTFTKNAAGSSNKPNHIIDHRVNSQIHDSSRSGYSSNKSRIKEKKKLSLIERNHNICRDFNLSPILEFGDPMLYNNYPSTWKDNFPCFKTGREAYNRMIKQLDTIATALRKVAKENRAMRDNPNQQVVLAQSIDNHLGTHLFQMFQDQRNQSKNEEKTYSKSVNPLNRKKIKQNTKTVQRNFLIGKSRTATEEFVLQARNAEYQAFVPQNLPEIEQKIINQLKQQQ
eukprot:TRINITY_DN11714_c0_g1_i1.p1 TRINITY_DN11714_c0_g1~~TRINITY_DN11714_c0_g1_i1.p1  ORF type:complete len:889 (+),score=222.54 TRINITY_DN11714_c0_g1_i1:53-2719(+)